MSIRLIAIFSLGASVGYVAHRPGEPAAAAAAARVEAAAQTLHDVVVREQAAPPPKVIVVRAPAPVAAPPEQESQGEVAQGDVPTVPDVTTAAEPRGVLEGKVLDPAGEAIYGVTVTLESLLGRPQQTRTDSDGAFRFDGLVSAAYKVHFRHYGGATEDRDVGVNQLDPTEVDVTLTRDE